MPDKNMAKLQRAYDAQEPDDTMTQAEEDAFHAAIDRLIGAVQSRASGMELEEIESWIQEVEG